MQTLEVISVNIWLILISLINLYLLFLILKKFLFKPVKKVLDSRQAELDAQYENASRAEELANESRRSWEEKLSTADKEADSIMQNATELASARSEAIVNEAKQKADGIIRAAQNEAELERRRSADIIKQEIVEVSGALAEKMLDREIKEEDHRDIINSFIDKMDKIGESNE